jgi:hypothetical protein
MELLAIRLSRLKTASKSLVIPLVEMTGECLSDHSVIPNACEES